MESLASEILAGRLRETMKTRGISSVQLARMAGLKTSFLYDILRNKSHNPSIFRLARVAETLDIPLAYLVGDVLPPVAAPHHDGLIQYIPYITVEDGKITTSATPYAPLQFHAGWLKEHTGKAENLRLFTITDDAMQPTLHVKDTVLIDIAKRKPSPEGMFLIRRKNELIARRLRYAAGVSGKLEILCDYPASLPENFPSASIEIAGRVIWVSRFI